MRFFYPEPIYTEMSVETNFVNPYGYERPGFPVPGPVWPGWPVVPWRLQPPPLPEEPYNSVYPRR